MSYDPACFTLAFAFLSDSSSALKLPKQDFEKHAQELAQAIQTTIEDYLQDIENEN